MCALVLGWLTVCSQHLSCLHADTVPDEAADTAAEGAMNLSDQSIDG